MKRVDGVWDLDGVQRKTLNELRDYVLRLSRPTLGTGSMWAERLVGAA